MRTLVPALLTATALVAPLATPARGQDVALPQPSPAAAVRQAVGVTDVEITYHRPGVKGRTIWGGLVPYDKVWRLGANEATTIRFGDPVKIAGHEVPAGTYGLFAIPAPAQWTLILNKQGQQWGAYSYKPEEDLFRLTVTPTTGSDVERMRFTIDPTGDGSAVVEMAWEKLRVAFTVETDVQATTWGRIDAALAKDPKDAKVSRLAAQYSLDTGTRRDQAWGWLAVYKAGGESFRTHALEAELLHRDGRVAEALVELMKAKDLAKATAPQDYLDQLDKKAEDWRREAK